MSTITTTTTTSPTTTEADAGPLPIPHAPDDRTGAAVRRLAGHATSADWLPIGLDDAVDKLRERQLAQRERTASAIAELAAAQVAFATEDSRHAEALREAQRGGKAAKDRRTPPADRERALSDLGAIQWASIEVMAEVVGEVIDGLREAEPRILAGLEEQAAVADDRIRRAEAEVRAAQIDHYVLLRSGMWLKATVDDGPFGAQPAPTPGPVPPGISRSAVAGALERRWHEVAA